MANDEQCRQINSRRDPGLLEVVSDLGVAAGQTGWQALFFISLMETTGSFGVL